MTDKPEEPSSLQPADKGSTGLVRVMDRRVTIATRVLSDIASKRAPRTGIGKAPRRITMEVAERFLRDEASEKLEEYTEIDLDAARSLATREWGNLNLSGLTVLDSDVARALAPFRGNGLQLSGLRHLTDAAAEAIIHCSCCELHLNGLSTLSDTVADCFVRSFGGEELYLLGLNDLSEAARDILLSEPRMKIPMHFDFEVFLEEGKSLGEMLYWQMWADYAARQRKSD